MRFLGCTYHELMALPDAYYAEAVQLYREIETARADG